MLVEECTPYFLDGTIKQPKILYRVDSKLGRIYYSLGEFGEPFFYLSVTTMIQMTMPTPVHLIKWIADKGFDAAEEYKEERASYGTFMHIKQNELLINRKVDLDLLESELVEYCTKELIPYNKSLILQWTDEIKKDLLSFARFIKDYDVEPLAIEIVLGSEDDGLAGAIDLVCRMTVMVNGFDKDNPYKTGPRKGQPRKCKVPQRIVAAVDYKSTKKGFHEENEIQLHTYRRLLGGIGVEIDKVFNYAPKHWRDEPGYHLKDQTNSFGAMKVPHLIELAKVEMLKRDFQHLHISGLLDLDNWTERSNYIVSDLKDFLRK